MKYILKYWFNILSFVVVFLIIFFGFQSIQQSTLENQRESLENALRRGILECYALEGRYPDTLDYLIDEYHIIYDENLFDVKYEIIASNMMPSITIIEKE